MKKNVMMRIASILLVCVLATTCGISGTYAKYVTKAEANDTARVAKWGIMLAVTGDGVFAEEYDGEGGKKTVISSNKDKLVAPGTENETGITFKITGTPEVAFKLTAGLGDDAKDVVLKAGTYTDYTKSPYIDTFTIDKDYYPVVFTLKHTFGTGAQSIKGAADAAGVTCNTNGNVDTITGTLAEINAVLAKLSEAMSQVNPNYVLDDTFELTWAWAFVQTNKDLYDKADTLLGNLAAGTATENADNYNLWLKYNFTITVEQVD